MSFTQEDLDAAIAKAVSDTNATRDVAEEGLKSNRDAILAEKTKGQADYAAYKLQKEADEEAVRQKALMERKNFEEIENDIKKTVESKHTLELKELQDANQALVSTAYNNTTSNLLGSFVKELRVSAVHAPAVKALLSQEQLAHVDGILTIGGQATSEWQTTFLASEYGQSVIVPPESTGGGAVGGSKGGKSSTAHERVVALAGSAASFGVQPDK